MQLLPLGRGDDGRGGLASRGELAERHGHAASRTAGLGASLGSSQR
ncbi:hypothetical protein QEG98_03525 [Myxococcus sp. MxC21-1]|nr:hypothetical protein [Myxococcus sp. MxC21-1]WNZ62896.1 hypothetical protein QEG98_03525 [Myxococcus sp. MxC21-1]